MKAQVPAEDEKSPRPETSAPARGFRARGARRARRHARLYGADRRARERRDSHAPARFGFTVTKKVAGAVGRNRIRRRLREALRLGGALGAKPGRDYVFVARPVALTAPFAELLAQMAEGLAQLE